MDNKEITRSFALAFKEKGYPLVSCNIVATICGTKEMRENYAPYHEALKRVTEFARESSSVDEVVAFALGLAKINLA